VKSGAIKYNRKKKDRKAWAAKGPLEEWIKNNALSFRSVQAARNVFNRNFFAFLQQSYPLLNEAGFIRPIY
jgi:hypothetical protein